MTGVEVRRAESRGVTRTEWLTSYHSFSFGDYYDPANLGFGLLQAHNDDTVAPRSGYDSHAHRDMEIVTWVLYGALTHRDSGGATHVLAPGQIQRMSAGSGIRHSERNESPDTPAHFVQMWVTPSQRGLPPSYQQRDVTAELGGGELVPVASGMQRHGSHAVVPIHQPGAALHVARIQEGSVPLPDAPYLHVFVARGEVTLEGVGPLRRGDAARLTEAEGGRVAAPAPAEILVWEMAP